MKHSGSEIFWKKYVGRAAGNYLSKWVVTRTFSYGYYLMEFYENDEIADVKGYMSLVIGGKTQFLMANVA